MATFMDVSLFSYFGPIFLFLMVFVIVYAFLSITKAFEKLPGKNALFAIIAISVSFFLLMYKPAMTVISVMIPWFTVLIMLTFLIMFVFKMFNQDETLWGSVIKQKSVMWTILTFVIIIVLASFSSTFGQTLLAEQVTETTTDGMITTVTNQTVPVTTTSTASSSFGNNVLMTLINPKVLGLILMLIIGMFTIMLLSDSQEAK
ncbi:MAG: hypothetical protein PHU51_00085 [Candidatus Nanoarchaeia archaeon]|nr:hypothetical protein [Candidatus Nanoarchaeia archaeon]